MQYDKQQGKYVALNNQDRSEWINNDEGLYNWWKSSRLSMAKFIKENKAEIDAAILRVLNAKPSR